MTSYPASQTDISLESTHSSKQARYGSQMIKKLSTLFTGLALILGVGLSITATPAKAMNHLILNCSQLQGTGTYSNPFIIGTVDRTTVVVGCPSLSSGRNFNTRYFRFGLRRTAPRGAAVGMIFTLTPNGRSAVHPGLVNPRNGVVIADTLTDGFWIGTPPTQGRFVSIGPLNRFRQPLPAGQWILRASKIDSPLRSLRTPSYNVVIWMGN